MSKTSNHAKLECLKAWTENRKFKAKRKPKKQPLWLKDMQVFADTELLRNDCDASSSYH